MSSRVYEPTVRCGWILYSACTDVPDNSIVPFEVTLYPLITKQRRFKSRRLHLDYV